MSDTSRLVPGPSRRRGSAADLLGKSIIVPDPSDIVDLAPEGTEPEPAVVSAPQVSYETPVEQVAYAALSVPAGTPIRPAPAAAAPLVKMTIRVRPDTRSRLRAVYYNTQALEMDKSIESLIENLIIAECERREELYNRGQRYPGGNSPSVPGRKPSI